MTLTAAGLLEDLLRCPVEITEVISQENTGKQSGGTGSAAHAKGNLVVELKVERRRENAADGENIHVGGEDEIVSRFAQRSALRPVASMWKSSASAASIVR